MINTQSFFSNDINDIRQYSTDQNLSKAFNVLYPDNTFGNSLYVDCHYTDKIFKFSELGNINRMLIRITNSLGQDINPNTKLYDYNVPTINSKTCTCHKYFDKGICKHLVAACLQVKVSLPGLEQLPKKVF